MHSNKKITEFNMLIVGTGGQGQITLLQVLAEAALIENLDFKSSELHGLSQRGGSVEVHIRFGKQIYSPMVSAGKADLILGLEMQESLMAANFAGLKTNFLVNKYII
ncbi:MAG: 2-oxoacid:acceptor oxidoreductase family protein, partial [bacterium]|nr:2-oxoacid:acceptor oxidoreductase family protein [bacterium]